MAEKTRTSRGLTGTQQQYNRHFSLSLRGKKVALYFRS